VILFEFEDDDTIKEMYALEKIVKKNSRELGFQMTAFLYNYLLLLIHKGETSEILSTIQKIKHMYHDFYEKKITVAVSSAKSFDQLHVLYQEAREILNYKFYLGKGCTITDKDLIEHATSGIMVNMNNIIEDIVISTKCGNIPAVKKAIEDFFEDFREKKLDKEIIYTYSIDLLTSIIRNNIDNIKENKQKDINSYFTDLPNIRHSNTIIEITDKIKKIALEITEFNYSTFTRKKNHLVQRILHKVSENLGNEQMNLKWLSENMVFANVDYLGKVFKKEMGIGFNQYLVQMRMEKAKQMLEEPGENMIYNIAMAVGFGHNSQYFSQVFKKYMGISPSDYRKNYLDNKTSL
jgi:two-component system response regulator YesN